MPNPLKRKENESIPGALKPGKSTRKINNLHTVFSYSGRRAAPQLGANSERRATVTTEDLLLEFMARVNNALSLEDDALRLRAVRKAKHWAEDEYEKLHGCSAGLIDVEEQS